MNIETEHKSPYLRKGVLLIGVLVLFWGSAAAAWSFPLRISIWRILPSLRGTPGGGTSEVLIFRSLLRASQSW